MDRITGRLTVFFEEPFWVGVFERSEGRKLSVCKVTFGTEPKIYEVYDFVLREYSKLKFSPAVDVVVKKEATNPKRVQREARKQAPLPVLEQNRNRLYKCKGKKTNWSENPSAVNSGKQRSSVNLN